MRRVVYVARHGETDWNAQARWQGHTNVPLNETGRDQARVLAKTLRAAGLAAVVSSDLSRAMETAAIVGAELSVALAYVDPNLRERALGVFEGLTRQECETLYPAAWQAWLESKRVPPGGEAHEALRARMIAAMDRVATGVARDDAPALVVSHGGAMRSIVAVATGEMPPPVANGAVWRLTWEGEQGLGRIVTAERLG
jgi:broad specificity phosphatase PhoE